MLKGGFKATEMKPVHLENVASKQPAMEAAH